MLRRYVKALAWFAATPLRWRYVTSKRWWHIAASCHWSTRLYFLGVPELDTGVCVGRRTTIRSEGSGRMVLGEEVWIGDDCEISVLEEIRIGQGTSVQHRSQLHGDVELGAGCVCAANLYIASSSHRFRDTPHLPIRWQDSAVGSLPAKDRSRRVVIEDDCWLGINVVICPGVIVGRGTVVGANAVVTTSTPPYSVVAGAPARVIGARFVFQPPSSVCVSRPEDNPYFYSGFVLPPIGQSWERAMSQGRWVGQRFALAMQLRQGNKLRLTTFATHAVRLTHGAQNFFVGPGESSLLLSPVLDNRGFLWFSVSGWGKQRLAICSACEVSVATPTEDSLIC